MSDSFTPIGKLIMARFSLILQEIRGQWNLFCVFFNRRLGRTEKARVHLDKVLLEHEKVHDGLLAYDGLLSLIEGHSEEARDKFSKCLANLPDQSNDDRKYIALYCGMILNADRVNFDWSGLSRAAAELRPGLTTRLMLPFPTEDKLSGT